MAQTSQHKGLITDINVTPLVDVVLVLLVILMTTASYAVSKAVPLDLPKASTGEANASPLVVAIDARGRIQVSGRFVTTDMLRAEARAAKSRDAGVRAAISADGATPHRDVVRVMDVLRKEGVNRFAVNVAPDTLDAR